MTITALAFRHRGDPLAEHDTLTDLPERFVQKPLPQNR